MKKKIFFIGLSVFLLTGCDINITIGNNKNVNETTNSDSSNLANEIVNDLKTELNPEDFVGSWSSQRPTVDVSKEANNTYKFLVHWGSSVNEYTQWDYTCNFDEENGLMDCTGSKTNAEFDDNQKETDTVVYKNGKATFTLGSNNKMYWNDAEEDAGADIVFDKE